MEYRCFGTILLISLFLFVAGLAVFTIEEVNCSQDENYIKTNCIIYDYTILINVCSDQYGNYQPYSGYIDVLYYVNSKIKIKVPKAIPEVCTHTKDMAINELNSQYPINSTFDCWYSKTHPEKYIFQHYPCNNVIKYISLGGIIFFMILSLVLMGIGLPRCMM